VRELRTLLVDIYPPNLEGSGLAPAVADLLAGVDTVAVSSELEEPPHLDPRVRAVLYRVAREVITNVTKHSGASHLDVKLAQEGPIVVLRVVDDGRGFDGGTQREGHLGLRLVEDLVTSVGGRLTLASAPGAGTSVTVEVEAS
jgi:signal transduction histidine kinase